MQATDVQKCYQQQSTAMDVVDTFWPHMMLLSPCHCPIVRMAANVTISAGLISKESGQLIKSLLKGGQVVTLALNWWVGGQL